MEYSPERNHFFLEFVGADSLTNSNVPREPDALLWFGDLLRSKLIGEHAVYRNQNMSQKILTYLRSFL